MLHTSYRCTFLYCNTLLYLIILLHSPVLPHIVPHCIASCTIVVLCAIVAPCCHTVVPCVCSIMLATMSFLHLAQCACHHVLSAPCLLYCCPNWLLLHHVMLLSHLLACNCCCPNCYHAISVVPLLLPCHCCRPIIVVVPIVGIVVTALLVSVCATALNPTHNKTSVMVSLEEAPPMPRYPLNTAMK